MTETQRQLARLRVALDGLGHETVWTRTREADLHLFEAFGALAVLEQETAGEADHDHLTKQFDGLSGPPPLMPMAIKS